MTHCQTVSNLHGQRRASRPRPGRSRIRLDMIVLAPVADHGSGQTQSAKAIDGSAQYPPGMGGAGWEKIVLSFVARLTSAV